MKPLPRAVLSASLWVVALALAGPVPVAAQAVGAGVAASAPAAQKKVLRVAFRIAETSFDPAKINDLYSRTLTPHIFESLFEYDYLARPPRIKPLTAAGMAEPSDGFRTWTVRIKPGIFFAADEAFKGKKRELVAQDYVYSYKRFADPAIKSPVWTTLEALKILGLNELRKQALDAKKPFNYDQEIDGLKALDRYTVQFRVADPRPRFAEANLTTADLFGAMAREVVEHYGDKIDGHPVGTGPFKLVQWRRSSFIALERNPDYREVLWHAEPNADDADGQAIAKKLSGRRLPLVDRVEVSIIEENQPRWLSFLNQRIDMLEEVPPEYINIAMPNGQVAPNLTKQGIGGRRVLRADIALMLFNMDHPVVGGYAPDKVALRRAIALAVDVEREIRLARYNMAVPAQSLYLPHTSGYRPQFKSEMGEFNLPKARALLDLHGYVDKDGDGWRDLPDGKPLLLEKHTQPDQQSRALDEQWERNMRALGLRMKFLPAKWPENLKAARAGKYMIWGVGSFAAGGDGQSSLQRYYGPMTGGQNMSRFKRPEMDALFDRMSVMPDGPERDALMRKAELIAIAYMPMKAHVHRLWADLWQPWLVGFKRPVFWQEWWHRVDIDTTKLPKAD